jgi:hypothetical protein
MNCTDISKAKFCEWVHWRDRSDLLRDDGPWLGVYLWGRFRRPPSVKPYPPLPRQVIYIGEAKNIDRRPLSGEHHRLSHYRATFQDDPHLQMLYASVCCVHRFGSGFASKKARTLYSRLRVYTQWVEASLYWEHTRIWGRPPALHYKKGTYGHEQG